MHYIVISPPITESVSYIDPEPPESFCCFVSVDADNEREAKIRAVKHKDMWEWVQEQRGGDANPFTGLQVSEGECRHGVCWCNMCGSECEKCLIEEEFYHA